MPRPIGNQGLFKSTGSLRPARSAFDLTYEKKLTCDMGQLIPIMCDEVVPGDTFHIGNEIVIRFQPMVAAIMEEVNCFIHYFFVPYRILWNLWESFITGGPAGTDASTLPRWTPGNTAIGSLWDYLGFPVGVSPTGALPMAFPQYAYNAIYNQYYRDQNLIAEVNITTNESILLRAWEKDYFTSALPWQQRGTAPSLPISGTVSAVFAADVGLVWPATTGAGAASFVYDNAAAQVPGNATTKTALEKGKALKTGLDNNTINLSSATTFNVSDLRLAFQIQKWLERNARAGARYTEFLQAHFGESPKDERLQRPEYIGGSKSRVTISEVLKTSSTDGTSPQGNMAGHGLLADRNFCATYHAQEYGLIMGIMSVMPRPSYSQGVDRQWLRTTKYDFYSPEFANLSERPSIRAEIYADGDSGHNNTVFGFTGIYDEMRCKRSQVCGKFRIGQAFDYWHLGRSFSSAPALNQTFIECVPSKRIFAVQTEPVLLVNLANVIKAIRPMPEIAEPGLIDHA